MADLIRRWSVNLSLAGMVRRIIEDGERFDLRGEPMDPAIRGFLERLQSPIEGEGDRDDRDG